jgi:hypothetical protein
MKEAQEILIESYEDGDGGELKNYSSTSIPVLVRRGRREIAPNDNWQKDVEDILK